MRLIKSQLVFVNGAIARLNQDGSTAARHEIGDVVGIEIVRRWDLSSLVGAGFLVAMTILAKRHIASEGWSWAVAITLGLLALMCLAQVPTSSLRLQLVDGEVRYAVQDDKEIVKGFVLAVRREARLHKGNCDDR